MKQKIMPIAMAAGIYGSIYAGLETMHNVDCPREDLHSQFSDSHMSKEMILDQKARDAEHIAWMQNAEKSRLETQQIFDDINRTMDEITFQIGVIHGILITENKLNPGSK